MSDQPKQYRRYRKITPAVIAQFHVATAQEGNRTAAVRKIDPTAKDADRRATLIALKSRELDAGEYVDAKMQQIAIEGIERVGRVVRSTDERTALKASMFIIDHVRGKALQRTEAKHLNLNINAVLD